MSQISGKKITKNDKLVKKKVTTCEKNEKDWEK